jgi:cytoskeleton protein RodZ
MDVGAHLRSARERRGLTIEQVGRSTKLSPSVLRHIERNEWDQLPGGLLTRGHLRAYAVEVGLDPELVVDEYLSQFSPEVVESPPRPVAAVADGSPKAGRTVLTAVVGLSLLMAGYRLLGTTPQEPAPRAQSFVESPAASVPTTARAGGPDAVPAAERTSRDSRFSLVIDVTGPCWVSAKADGRTVAFRLFEPGDTMTVDATQELVLRVGAPESFRYTLNGASGRPLGERGQPVTVTINESNLRTFLPNASSDRDARD